LVRCFHSPKSMEHNTSNARGLSARQNEPHFIDLLAATSHYYGLGKIALAVQLCLTVGLAIAFSAIVCFWPEFKPIAAFVALTITWLDVTFIDRIQIYFRKLGALVQEQTDCELFGIEWNELRCGRKPDSEDLHCAAAKFISARGDSGLRDWHAADLDGLSAPYVPLASQRLCLWWEKSQRKVYGCWLIGLGIAGMILVGSWGVICAQSIKETLLVSYAMAAPAVIWCIREGRRQWDAAASLEHARAFVDSTWKKAVSGLVHGRELEFLIRQIQDSMFDNRSKNPLMFNWIYRILKQSREETMRKSAGELVSELQRLKDCDRLNGG